MATLILMGIVLMGLIGVFGYAVGVYLTLYKFGLKNTLARVATCIATGTVVSFAIFYVALFMVWPGI